MKDKIKEFFKENGKGLLILFALFIICNYRLDISIYKPGGVINLDNRISSEDKLYESKGSINMTYVSLVKGTIPTYLIAKILPTWDIVKNENITYDESGDISTTIKIDRYYLEESISNAYLVAFEEANKDYEIIDSNNYVTYIADDAKTNLKLFDNIQKYDNIEFTTFKNMQEYITTKNVGDKINFVVLRDNKIVECYAELIDIGGFAKVGLATAVINEYSSIPDIDVKSKKSESGSSGGFMTALAIYNAITENDITKGSIIAGTGTIDNEGMVGEIGGVKYKLSGAVKNDADVFLVPSANYQEALEYKKEQNLDIELISVKNFHEAIFYLNNREV